MVENYVVAYKDLYMRLPAIYDGAFKEPEEGEPSVTCPWIHPSPVFAAALKKKRRRTRKKSFAPAGYTGNQNRARANNSDDDIDIPTDFIFGA